MITRLPLKYAKVRSHDCVIVWLFESSVVPPRVKLSGRGGMYLLPPPPDVGVVPPFPEPLPPVGLVVPSAFLVPFFSCSSTQVMSVQHRHDVDNRHGVLLGYAYVATSRKCSNKIGIPLDFRNSIEALDILACAESLAHRGLGRPFAGHLRITFSVVSHNFPFFLNSYAYNDLKTGILLCCRRDFLPAATHCV